MAAPTLDRKAARELFEISDDVVYMNSASLAPRLRAVTAAGRAALARQAAPWTIGTDDWFAGGERLRGLFAGLVGAEPGDVALVPGVSYGIAIAAKNVPIEAGNNVVVLEQQYPSNVYAWRRAAVENGAVLRTVARSTAFDLTETLLAAIDERTAAVAVPNCHWTDGALLDLERVGSAAREIGAALVVDASQSLGALPLDVAAVRPDFLVTVGYKWLLGPYALGYLYVAERWQREGQPLEESWATRAGSEDFARLVDYVDDYRPGARRFDVGEYPRFLAVPMAAAALAQIADWGIASVQATLTQVTAAIERRAAALGLLPTQPFARAGHLLGLRFAGSLPEGLEAELARRRVHVSLRGRTLRVAPHLHTSDEDVERLLDALAACT